MDDAELPHPTSPEAKRVDAYQDTVRRLEPDITMIDHDAAMASIAISLKRIADSLDPLKGLGELTKLLTDKMREEGLL